QEKAHRLLKAVQVAARDQYPNLQLRLRTRPAPPRPCPPAGVLGDQYRFAVQPRNRSTLLSQRLQRPAKRRRAARTAGLPGRFEAQKRKRTWRQIGHEEARADAAFVQPWVRRRQCPREMRR